MNLHNFDRFSSLVVNVFLGDVSDFSSYNSLHCIIQFLCYFIVMLIDGELFCYFKMKRMERELDD